ncbi:MAG: thioredoxin-dependent thiol peroxidase [Candidatus Eisenbacteria bacterium]
MAVKELKIGNKAPAFTAGTDTGEKVSLSDYLGKKVILFFYPKDNTPGCTKQACGFRDRAKEAGKKNAVILGVSPDGEKSHVKFKEKFGLPYTLLVDDDHAVAEKYGVWQEKSMYGRKYMGMVRSHFVIDEEGKLIDVRVKVKPEESVETALEAL